MLETGRLVQFLWQHFQPSYLAKNFYHFAVCLSKLVLSSISEHLIVFLYTFLSFAERPGKQSSQTYRLVLVCFWFYRVVCSHTFQGTCICSFQHNKLGGFHPFGSLDPCFSRLTASCSSVVLSCWCRLRCQSGLERNFLMCFWMEGSTCGDR